jgi:hypothetical protein
LAKEEGKERKSPGIRQITPFRSDGGAVVLTSKHMGGVTNNMFTNLTPETWYLTK